MKKKLTKKQHVENHFYHYNTITSIEAIKHYLVTRLSAVVYRLKSQGWEFETTYEKNYATGTTFARYKVTKMPQGFKPTGV